MPQNVPPPPAPLTAAMLDAQVSPKEVGQSSEQGVTEILKDKSTSSDELLELEPDRSTVQMDTDATRAQEAKGANSDEAESLLPNIAEMA